MTPNNVLKAVKWFIHYKLYLNKFSEISINTNLFIHGSAQEQDEVCEAEVVESADNNNRSSSVFVQTSYATEITVVRKSTACSGTLAAALANSRVVFNSRNFKDYTAQLVRELALLFSLTDEQVVAIGMAWKNEYKTAKLERDLRHSTDNVVVDVERFQAMQTISFQLSAIPWSAGENEFYIR